MRSAPGNSESASPNARFIQALAAKSLETVRLTEALSIAPDDESARSALAEHLSELRRSAAELGFTHLGSAVAEVLTRLEREAFGPASLRAARVLAWRYEPLAVMPSQSGTHPVASPPAEPSLSGRRVLVADDEAEVRWFYVGVLREAGASVIEARDGVHALELARSESPDVILADIVMPRLDGLGLCAAVRREPLLDGVPVVLLSWRDDFLHRMRELRADAQGYLRKEVPARQVLDRVSSVLEPLTRLEEALRSDREALGDLEELGVSRLLQATRRLRPNASIVFQDPWSLFDLELREGRIVSVTRTAIDGAITQGAAALPALVGMSSGRFVVAEPPAGQTIEDREPLDDPFIAATQRLGGFLNAIAAHPDCRVEFDPDVLGTYVRHSPTRVQRLIAVLVGGAPPDVLWESGASSRALVDALLVTLARQGAIHAVHLRESDTNRDVTVPMPASEGGPAAEPLPRQELNEPEIQQESQEVSDPPERENCRAQSAIAMHREPANKVQSFTYPIWRLGTGAGRGTTDSDSGFGMELQVRSRLFGLAFLILFAATVAFLIWNQVTRVSESVGSPAARPTPVEVRGSAEVRGSMEPQAPIAPAPVPPPSPDILDLSSFAGHLRPGVDPSLGASEAQGALELSGPAEVTVDVDGVSRGALPVTLVLDQGRHRVHYRVGSRSTDRFCYVKSGATRALRIVTQPGGFVDGR